MEPDRPSERPPFDIRLAQRLVGKRVLIGLTYEGKGEVRRQEQKHGVVDDVTEEGVAVRIPKEGIYWLPPDLRPWRSAVEGEYRLPSTGEIVINPDYITTWRVTPGQSDSDGRPPD